MDVLGHVNNAISWAAVEDELSPLDWLPVRGEVEHNGEIVPTDAPRLARAISDAGLDLWLVASRVSDICPAPSIVTARQARYGR